MGAPAPSSTLKDTTMACLASIGTAVVMMVVTSSCTAARRRLSVCCSSTCYPNRDCLLVIVCTHDCLHGLQLATTWTGQVHLVLRMFTVVWIAIACTISLLPPSSWSVLTLNKKDSSNNLFPSRSALVRNDLEWDHTKTCRYWARKRLFCYRAN
jgi:hypothetical protein